MKLLSYLVIPCLAASIFFMPSAVNAAQCPPNAPGHHENAHFKADQQKWLMQIIDEYASPELNIQLKKDLATREQLMNEWRKTPAYQKHKAQCKKKREAFYQANKQKIDNIWKQFEAGKLSKQQAYEQLAALHGKQKGAHSVFKQLKSAVLSKDRAAIQAALEKLDLQVKESNKRLLLKISDHT